jgi:predicted metalloprotease with PDZ domain
MPQYTIFPKHPAAHLFEVTVTVASPAPDGQRFMLPVWIPGSYMVREFARNIVRLSAMSSNRPVAVEKIDKCTWQCAPCDGPLTLTYEVYAWDLSVRAAHLDETHAFFNGTSVFLRAEGMDDSPCELTILPPAGEQFAGRQIATALRQTQALARLPGQKVPEIRTDAGVSLPGVKSFGTFLAADYDELIDHPVEIGTFTHAAFEACGVTHHIAITGQHRADLNRLCADLKKICEAQIRLFEPDTGKAPMDEYWFLVMAIGDGFGGLEHRASTALICGRDDLPQAHDSKVGNGYRRFLSLASHEYFHTWNVKRIKPAVFIDYDLRQENYTRQLWFFEGITDYFDDLMLARTGLVTPLQYLEIEAENIGKVMAQSARLKQSVADSSFDAWIKYYRQDENAPNAVVSYYQKGAIIGMALDLTLRQRTHGAISLDDVMRALWKQYGKTGTGVPEGGIQAVAERISGLDLGDFFARAVYGTADIDLKPLFDFVGIDLGWKVPGQANASDPVPATLGAKIGGDSNGDAKLQQVFDGSAAQAAGLSAGDTVIAVDGLRVNAATLEKRIRTYPPGSVVTFTAFRRDEMKTFTVTLQAQAATTCVLTTRDTPAEAKTQRDRWLLGRP